MIVYDNKYFNMSLLLLMDQGDVDLTYEDEPRCQPSSYVQLLKHKIQ